MAGEMVALTRTMLGHTRWEIQQLWLLPSADGHGVMEGPGVHPPADGAVSPKLFPALKPLQWCFHLLPLKAPHAPEMSLWVSFMSSLCQPQLSRVSVVQGGSEVQPHGLAMALWREELLHTLLLCGCRSDLSKLLLGRNQATGHDFSWRYSFSLLKTLLIFFFFPTEFKGTWGSPTPTKAKPLGSAAES